MYPGKVSGQTIFLTKISFFIIFWLLLSGQAFSQDYEIDEVKFVHKDTKTFDDGVLSDAVAITKEDIYKPKILNDDVTKLKKFYFDNGFFDVSVDTSVIYNNDDGNAVVSFFILEKRHYRIDSLEYKGLESISESLDHSEDSIQFIKSKDYYSKALIVQQSSVIVDLLQNNGYMNASIKNDSGTTVIKHDTSVSVIITFEHVDTVYKFGKTTISIKDNVYGVDESLFPKVITFNEGDIYSKAEKLHTERNMSQYAIVQSARLQPDSNYTGQTVDFTANISLTKKHEVTPYIEATNIDNYFYAGGGARYVDRYFLSGGKVLTLAASGLFNSIKINRVEMIAAITQPYVFNIHSNLTDKITLGLYNLDGFKNYYAGNLTTLNYFISDHTFYNSAVLDLDEEMVWFKYNIDSTGTLTEFNSFLSATIIHDNTNNATSPSRGFYHSITAGSAGLIPSLLIKLFNKNVFYSQFVKFATSNRFYLDLAKVAPTLVLATKFNVGDIIEYGSSDRILPVLPIYRFFSGGSNSLRGWTPKSNGVVADTKRGGNFQVEGSVEFRKKLFPKSPSWTKNLGAVVFFDYGNIWETQKIFRFNQIAMDVGFGVRYDLFIGPVRVDIGWKLFDPTNQHNEKWLFSNFSKVFKDKMAISFGIGEAF